MADFTLLGVHLHDGFEFSPINNASLLPKGAGALTDADDEPHDDYNTEFDAKFDTDESDEFDEADDAESGGHPGLGLPVGLVLLAGIAAAARYICDGDDDFDRLTNLDGTDGKERDEIEVDA